MKVRTKLLLNSGVGVLLMGGIGAVSVTGTRFIQAEVTDLTQRSTPYQVSVFGHQRALQAHAANLLKVAAAESPEEFKLGAAAARESLAEEMRAAAELEKLSGKASDAGKDIQKISTSVLEMTEKRLSAEASMVEAGAAMKQKLEEATTALSGVNAAVRKLQQESVQKMLTSIDVTVGARKHAINLERIRNGLKDLVLFATRVPATSDKRTLANLKEEAEALTNSVAQTIRASSWGVEGEGDIGQDLEKRLKDTGAKITGAAALRLKFLKEEDDSLPPRIERLAKDAEYEIAYMAPSVAKEAERAAAALKSHTDNMSKSVEGFTAANRVLMAASAVMVLNQTLASSIQSCLAARSLSEFDKAFAAVGETLGRAEESQRQLDAEMAKAKGVLRLPATARGGLGVIRAAFLGQGGVSERSRGHLQIREEISALNQRMKEIVAQRMQVANKDVAQARTTQGEAVASVGRAVRLTTLVTALIAIGAAVLSIGWSTWIGRSIVRQIGALTQVAERFGSGDFTVTLDTSRRDEFGQLAGHFGHAAEQLRHMARRLSEAMQRLADSSRGLSGTSEELHELAQRQAAQTSQSAAAIHEINQTVTQVSQNAGNASAASKESCRLAMAGKDIVSETLGRMQEIADSVGEAGQTIAKLRDSSDRIRDIIGLIDEIADQTNLLALNAAIEAARAGEQGRGFAVVADEVRKLAERTASATQEITGIIHEIHGDTERSVTAMNQGTGRVTEGVKLAREAARSLEDTVTASQRGVDMAQMIASATVEQSAATANVAHSMEDISDMTRQLEASTDGIRKESDALTRVAGELGAVAAWFKI